MLGLNKAYFIGRVGNDPELRTSAAKGTPYCKLSLATPNHRKVEDQWVDTPDWHRLTAFGPTAERLARNVHKGDGLAVECTVRQGKWTDKEGNAHYETNLVVDRVLWSMPRAARAQEFGSATPPGAVVIEAEGVGSEAEPMAPSPVPAHDDIPF